MKINGLYRHIGAVSLLCMALPSPGQSVSVSAFRRQTTTAKQSANRLRHDELREEMVRAVQEGSLTKVKHLLGQGVSVYTQDPYGNSLLQLAVRGKHQIELVRFLLTREVDARLRTKDANDALSEAAGVGNVAAARLLLSRGAQVNSKDAQGSTPLLNAAQSDSTEMVAFLLKQGAQVNARDRRGQTALRLAARRHSTAIGKLLLAAGARPDPTGDQESSALINATISGDNDLVKSLLEHGAQVNARSGGQTALGWAARSGNRALVLLLLAKGADPKMAERGAPTPLVAVASAGNMQSAIIGVYAYGGVLTAERKAEALQNAEADDTAIAAALLEKGVEVNAPDFRGMTALLYAAHVGTTSLVKLLLEHGAEAGRQDRDGNTALLGASEGGHAESVRLLLAKGADANATNQAGQTALILVAAHGKSEVVRQLPEIRKGILHRTEEASEHPVSPQITPQEMDIWKKWALDGDSEVVKALLEKGANIEGKDKMGETALLWAVRQNNMPVAQALIAAGADVNAHNQQSETALQIAAKAHADDIAGLLKQAGAKK